MVQVIRVPIAKLLCRWLVLAVVPNLLRVLFVIFFYGRNERNKRWPGWLPPCVVHEKGTGGRCKIFT